MDKWSCFWKFNNFFFANIVYDVLSFLSVICILEKKKLTSKYQEISINEWKQILNQSCLVLNSD